MKPLPPTFHSNTPKTQISDVQNEAHFGMESSTSVDRLNRYSQSSMRLSKRTSLQAPASINPFDPRFVMVSCKVQQKLNELPDEDKKHCQMFFQMKREGMSTEKICDLLLGEDDVGAHDDLVKNVHEAISDMLDHPMYSATAFAFCGLTPDERTDWIEEGRV